MLYPIRFVSGSAHNLRVAALRQVADSTQDEDGHAAAPFVAPFRFLRFQRADDNDNRTRGWYIVDFGHGEIALERGQVELVLLGFVAALAVTAAASRDTVAEWISGLSKAFEDGHVPKPWTA